MTFNDEYIDALVKDKGKAKVISMVPFNRKMNTPKEEDVRNQIVSAARELESAYATLLNPSRETSLAMTRLEESVMWADTSVAVSGVRGE